MSRIETIKSEIPNQPPSSVLEKVAKELQRHGVRVRIKPDWRGIPDLYIPEEDARALEKPCREGRLSKDARELLC